MVNKMVKKVAGEWLLVLSAMGLAVTSLYLKRFPTYTPNDFKVIYTLFVFLIILNGLERSGFLSCVASRFKRGRHLPQKLILLTALLSVFVTNDVALLTVVPFTLTLNVDGTEMLVILETLTANGVSALTPFGNPQNIFIYYYYHLHPWEFVRTIAPFTVASFIFVLSISYRRAKMAIADDSDEVVRCDNKKTCVYLISFPLFVLSILRLLPLEIGVFVIAYAILFDRRSLGIDYPLLATFLTFFGFTDNLMRIFKFSLENPVQVFLYSAVGSQIMSNVPSALFFADFTSNWKALLWGVSVGGFGNLIGSLASLISYRFYRAKFPNSRSFLIRFHLYGYLAFFLGCAMYFLATGNMFGG